MNDSERLLINEFLTFRENYYKRDLEYWEDELRRFPFPAIASSYSNALLRYEVFEDFRRMLSSLLDDQ